MTTPEDPGATNEPTPPQQPDAGPYGQPPASPQYGQPPAPPYGAPPPAGQYGQPAPGQYGQPYGAPAGYGYGAPAGNYGSWPARVGAAIIDALVAAPGWILYYIGLAVGGGAGAFLAIIGVLVAIGISVWNRWIRMGNTGQSIGKQTLNLKLIREADGQPMGAGMAFVRDIAHVLDGIPCYIGYLWPLWDSKRQTFADKVCSSVVVQL